jgi:hypothetical protein
VNVSIAESDACVGVYQDPGNPNVTYVVTRQDDHLMIQWTGGKQRFEIKPESDVDYYMQFLNWDFHFIPDGSGKITRLEIKTDRLIKTKRIK